MSLFSQKAKKLLLSSLLPILATLFLAVLIISADWTPPNEIPPNCTTDPASPLYHPGCLVPLNVGSDDQSKEGWLTVGNTVAPSYNLDIQGVGGLLGALRTTGGAILNTGGASTGLIVQYGNVGIGTTTPDPAFKLDVAGDMRATSYRWLNTDLDPDQWWAAHITIPSGSLQWIYNDGVNPTQALFRFYPNGDFFVTDGRIGIGGTPDERLHVNGNIQVDNGNIQVDNSAAGWVSEIRSRGQLYLHPDVDNSGDDSVIFMDSDGNELMRVSEPSEVEGVRVGIGTPTPTQRLDVNGITHMRDSLRFNNFKTISFQGTGDPGNNWALYGSAGETVLNAPGGGLIAFKIGNNEKMRIESDGDVGIGTSNPTEKLEVEGNVKAWNFITGDITFQKNNEKLWRMFEDEDGLYLENLKTGKVYKFLLEEI